ncbi:MAG: HAD family hydrolase, partial [Chloroflexi bacterium]|nr:HAD family hydrolase [Chloroflexota bacterium]
MSVFAVGPADFNPRLVIFDKDGTLIDFHFMWARWVCELATRLELAAQLPLAERVFAAVAFDPIYNQVVPTGALALAPMAELRELVAAVLCKSGISFARAKALVAEVWFNPDPVGSARPLADLPHLFGTLRAHHILIAIATSDDRAPTQLTLEALGLASAVSATVCADDQLPIKPAADM